MRVFPFSRLPPPSTSHFSPMKIPTLALGAVAVLGIVLGITQYSARTRLDAELLASQARSDELNSALTDAKSRQATLLQELTSSRGETEEFQARLAASETQVSRLTREGAELQLQLAASAASSEELRQETDALRHELAALKLTASTLSLAEVDELHATIAALEDRLASLEPASPGATAGSAEFPAPVPGSRYEVLSVGPGDAFVILAYSRQQGARPSQQLHIAREGEPLATVQIMEVRDPFAIAHVRPETLRRGLRKGDSASIPSAP